MTEERTWFMPLLVVVVVMLCGMYVVGLGISKDIDSANREKHVIIVNGNAISSIVPDEAVVMIRLETLEKDSALSQKRNAEMADEIRKELLAKGIAAKDIKTMSYDVNLIEQKNWVNDTYVKYIEGYRTVHVIEVVTSEADDVGDITDLAVSEGAEVSQVYFRLSESKKGSIEDDLIKEAVEDAKLKAKNIAEAAGASAGKLVDASYGSVSYPYRYYYQEAMGSAKDSSTIISPGEMEVSVQVSASFEIV